MLGYVDDADVHDALWSCSRLDDDSGDFEYGVLDSVPSNGGSGLLDDILRMGQSHDHSDVVKNANSRNVPASLQEVGTDMSHDKESTRGSGVHGICAGPTLMDIEWALATSSLCNPSSDSAHFMGAVHNIALLADTSSSRSTQWSAATPNHRAIDMIAESPWDSSNWRQKLLKRSHLQHKYSVHARSEAEAIEDGHKWRKYGQKIIKNSSFPRSYYKCSNANCNAKKQIERQHEEQHVFLVAYEGVHTHYKLP